MDKNSLTSLKSDFTLVDIWRKQNLQEVSYTWSNKDHSQASRINPFFIAKSLVRDVLFSSIFRACYQITISLNWRFQLTAFRAIGLAFGALITPYCLTLNSNKIYLVLSPTFSPKFLISVLSVNGGIASRLKFEMFVLEFCVRKKKSVNLERISLTKRLIRTKNALHASKFGDASIVNSLESQLSSLITKKAEGTKIRPRAQWFEEGERPTWYFFALNRKEQKAILLLVLLIKMV